MRKKQHWELQKKYSSEHQDLLDEKTALGTPKKLERMKKSFSLGKQPNLLRFLRRQLIDPLKNYRISKIQSRATQKSYQDWIKNMIRLHERKVRF